MTTQSDNPDSAFADFVKLGLIVLSRLNFYDRDTKWILNPATSEEPVRHLKHLATLLLGSSSPGQSGHAAAVAGGLRKEGFSALVVSNTAAESGKADGDISRNNLELRPIEPHTKESVQEILKSWGTRSLKGYFSDMATILTAPGVLTSNDRLDAECYVLCYALERINHRVQAGRIVWKSEKASGPAAILRDSFSKENRLWDYCHDNWPLYYELPVSEAGFIRRFYSDLLEGNDLLATRENVDAILTFIVDLEDFVLTKADPLNMSTKDSDVMDMIQQLQKRLHILRIIVKSNILHSILNDPSIDHSLRRDRKAYNGLRTTEQIEGIMKASNYPEDEELGFILNGTGAQSVHIMRYYTSLFAWIEATRYFSRSRVQKLDLRFVDGPSPTLFKLGDKCGLRERFFEQVSDELWSTTLADSDFERYKATLEKILQSISERTYKTAYHPEAIMMNLARNYRSGSSGVSDESTLRFLETVFGSSAVHIGMGRPSCYACWKLSKSMKTTYGDWEVQLQGSYGRAYPWNPPTDLPEDVTKPFWNDVCDAVARVIKVIAPRRASPVDDWY